MSKVGSRTRKGTEENCLRCFYQKAQTNDTEENLGACRSSWIRKIFVREDKRRKYGERDNLINKGKVKH